MATFDYTHVVFFFNVDPVPFSFETDAISGTLDDGDTGDTTFEAGDLATGVNSSGNPVADSPYLGTTVIDGQTWPVFFMERNQEIGVFMSQAPVNVPALLQLNEDATFPVCFLTGTAIATPSGDVAVETLAIGDMITTADGRAVPVKWIGRQTLSTRFGPAARLMPVRVREGALGGGLPERDLILTADHALLIDGLLINAGALVNGSSIDWVPSSELGDSYTVYHVETEDHDIILAEGAPAETFIDYVQRRAFDNYAEYLALYGEERTITEMPYPRISAVRLLPPQIRARLAAHQAA